MPLLHRSIADIPEKELVAHVLGDWHYRDTLFNIKGMLTSGADVRWEVDRRRFRKDLTGDFDILVVPPDAPAQATAIQVKRFPVIAGVHDARPGHWKRMARLCAEGAQQANDDARLGFSQVYVWIFVVIDTREQNGGRYTYDGPDSHLRSLIQQSISPFNLDARVGVMHFEWVQPMDRAPFELSTHSSHLVQLAQSAERQPSDLTDWLASGVTPSLRVGVRLLTD